MTRVRPIQAEDAEAFVALRQRGLIEVPLAFGSSPEDDRFRATQAVLDALKTGEDQAMIGAFEDGMLLGMIGIYRDHHLKARHKMHIWGMYVAPEARRRGLARRLMEAAVAHARTVRGVEWVNLGVSSTAPGARALYEGLGFRTWGTEPDALRHAGESGDEVWMTLRLDPRAE